MSDHLEKTDIRCKTSSLYIISHHLNNWSLVTRSVCLYKFSSVGCFCLPSQLSLPKGNISLLHATFSSVAKGFLLLPTQHSLLRGSFMTYQPLTSQRNSDFLPSFCLPSLLRFILLEFLNCYCVLGTVQDTNKEALNEIVSVFSNITFTCSLPFFLDDSKFIVSSNPGFQLLWSLQI